MDTPAAPPPSPALRPAPKPPTTTGGPAPTANGPIDPAVLAAAQGQPVDGEGEGQLHHAAGFMNQPWVQNVLPLATSLFLHVGIIVLGIVLYKAVAPLVNPNKEQVIIPQSASLQKSKTPGGVKHPGPPADPTRDAMQDQTKDTDNQGFAADASNKLLSASGAAGDSSAFGLGPTPRAATATRSATGRAAAARPPWGVPGGGEGMLPAAT